MMMGMLLELTEAEMDGDLLKQIQKGKKLKKTVTNDRSAPQIGLLLPAFHFTHCRILSK